MQEIDNKTYGELTLLSTKDIFFNHKYHNTLSHFFQVILNKKQIKFFGLSVKILHCDALLFFMIKYDIYKMIYGLVT